jgi:isoquinoline 1-oxidoreductase subunit alpha
LATFQLTVNGNAQRIEADPDMPLLWAIREKLRLTGTKYGCGMAQCGACTVHMDGFPVRSCSINIAAAAGRRITTIEGLSNDNSHPVQQAWITEQVPQCGYCQSGQIMTAVALLASNPNPSDAEIDAAMQGNLCRCGTYLRIRKAVRSAASAQGSKQPSSEA